MEWFAGRRGHGSEGWPSLLCALVAGPNPLEILAKATLTYSVLTWLAARGIAAHEMASGSFGGPHPGGTGVLLNFLGAVSVTALPFYLAYVALRVTKAANVPWYLSAPMSATLFLTLTYAYASNGSGGFGDVVRAGLLPLVLYLLPVFFVSAMRLRIPRVDRPTAGVDVGEAPTRHLPPSELGISRLSFRVGLDR